MSQRVSNRTREFCVAPEAHAIPQRPIYPDCLREVTPRNAGRAPRIAQSPQGNSAQQSSMRKRTFAPFLGGAATPSPGTNTTASLRNMSCGVPRLSQPWLSEGRPAGMPSFTRPRRSPDAAAHFGGHVILHQSPFGRAFRPFLALTVRKPMAMSRRHVSCRMCHRRRPHTRISSTNVDPRQVQV